MVVDPYNRCLRCQGNGVVTAVKIVDGAESSGLYAFRCDCSFGDADPRKTYPQWNLGFEMKGFRLK